jgi:hypothetical protein
MPTDHLSLSRRLDREWRALARQPAAIAHANAWQVVDWHIGHLDELLRAAGFATPPSAAANAVLGRLVTIAHRDELAGRITLQRVLPGLLAIARRRRGYERDAFEELAGAAWLAIAGCRTEGKEHIAASIVHDAAYRAFTAPGRRRAATEVVVDPRTLDDTPSVEHLAPCEELARLLAEARARGVPATDLELVRQLADLGSTTKVAEARQVTARTIRNHRDRAAARLREIAIDAA